MTDGAPLVVAGLQTAGRPGDVEGNLDLLRDAAAQARGRGADLLITPEMFLTGYNIGDALPRLAEGDLLGPVAAIAREHGLALVVGGPEPAPEGIYNTAFAFDATGALLGRHRKAHLFGDLDRALFVAGDRPFTAVDLRGVRMAMCICYDVEFPETVRAAALDGAHLMAVPTAQMEPFRFVAEQVIRARAWESQIYVAYVNPDGREADLQYVGRSSIVGPDATVLDAVVGGEALLCAAVDPAVVAEARAANPYLDDRRRDLFSEGAEDRAPRPTRSRRRSNHAGRPRPATPSGSF
jgi:5-aminopentanamidase